MESANHPGWIVMARDGARDAFPRRFAVCISDEEAAVLEIAQRIPEQSCLSERPITAAEMVKFCLKPGEYIQL
jgi:hypothetical protein